MDAYGLSPRALLLLSFFVSFACFAVKNFVENLEANHPKKSPLLDEGLVGDSGTGQWQPATGRTASSKPSSVSELNEFKFG
jgi:hypothetical protein